VDANRFAAITRQVGAAANRRAAVGILAAGLTAALVGQPGMEDVEAGIPILHCKTVGKKCKKNKSCCLGRCNKGHCMCGRKGHQCWEPLEGGGCCSNKCQDGRCK